MSSYQGEMHQQQQPQRPQRIQQPLRHPHPRSRSQRDEPENRMYGAGAAAEPGPAVPLKDQDLSTSSSPLSSRSPLAAPARPFAQPRRPSGARPSPREVPAGPPVMPSGMPVSAQVARSAMPFPQPQHHQQHHQQAYQSQRRHQSNQQQQHQHQYNNQGASSSIAYKEVKVASPRVVHAARTHTTARVHSSSTSPLTTPEMGSPEVFLRESSRANVPRPTHVPRQPSSTLSWDKSPKEAWLATPQEAYTPSVPHLAYQDPVDVQFDQLLDSLDVPEAVRQKFGTVSIGVKTSILSASTNANSASNALGLPPKEQPPKLRNRLSTPLLRKAKSSSSLGSPGPNARVGETYRVEGDSFVIVKSPQLAASSHRQSVDLPRPGSKMSSVHAASRPMSFGLFPSSLGKQTGKGLGIAMTESGPEGPEGFIQWLRMYRATDPNMEVARMKKLRMVLRHENTAWVGAFLDMGGYSLVLARLQELLDVEWREEQHGDQMLYELLRVVKGLSTSAVGRNALRASYPEPFPALSALLFSEKKPGDLAIRQIIVELWTLLFTLFSPSSASSPTSSSRPQSLVRPNPESRPSSVRFDSDPLAGPSTVKIVQDVHALLAPVDPDDKYANQHAFVTQAHRPRVFKKWVGELSDICRDYFWVMCHGSNTLWPLDEVDPDLVEKPVAPGGATGGVEFEAMNYVTMHFKLLNRLCGAMAQEDPRACTQLHQDLLSSGMDRILVTLRKASTSYYPTLHLELARYVSHLQLASPKGKLPHLIDKLIGPPPEAVRKRGTNAQWLRGLDGIDMGRDGGRRGGWDGAI